MKEYRRGWGTYVFVSKNTFNHYLPFRDFYHLSLSYSDELVIFLFFLLFFCSKDVYTGAFFCADAAMTLQCAALLLFD
jgi:hypothetical protein